MQEFVGHALVNQDACGVGRLALLCHEQCGVVLCPDGAVVTQVAGEGFFTPGTVAGVGNGGEGRQALELARVAQGQRECAVTAHAVAADAQALQVDGQVAANHGQQLIDDVAFHAPVARPGHLLGIEVKACAYAEIPAVGFALDVGTTRAGVAGNQGHAQFGCQALCASLDHESFFRTGQSGQVQQGGYFFALNGLWRQVDRELHGQANFAGIVLVVALCATKAGVGVDQFKRGGHGATPGKIAAFAACIRLSDGKHSES